jgi:hypothetical protein
VSGGARWLARLWGGRSRRVAAAYRESLGRAPDVLADLARLCHAQHPTIVPGDPLGTAFNEGKRAVWLHIAELLALRPDDLPSIPQEVSHDSRDEP